MGQSRREFLADVGRGMLIASVGSSLAVDLGLARRLPPMPGRRRCRSAIWNRWSA
jgi:hypothetical protein